MKPVQKLGEKYISRKGLLERDWSVTLVSKYLLRPNLLDRNRSEGKNQRPSCLYSLERVKRMEQLPSFIERKGATCI